MPPPSGWLVFPPGGWLVLPPGWLPVEPGGCVPVDPAPTKTNQSKRTHSVFMGRDLTEGKSFVYLMPINIAGQTKPLGVDSVAVAFAAFGGAFFCYTFLAVILPRQTLVIFWMSTVGATVSF